MHSAPIEWSFSYSGPKLATRDKTCKGCIASAFDAAAPACLDHAGAVAALRMHVVSEDAEAWFDAARALIWLELAAMPDDCVLRIVARGDENTPGNNRRNLAIEVSTIG